MRIEHYFTCKDSRPRCFTVFALLLSVSAGCGPRQTDLRRFLRDHPRAERMHLGTRPSYKILYDIEPEDRAPTHRQSIAVFDRHWKECYRRDAPPHEENLSVCLGKPYVVPLQVPALAYCLQESGVWYTRTPLVLVALRGGRAYELELDCGASGMGPGATYNHLYWLEDMDGDGQTEICRFWSPNAGHDPGDPDSWRFFIRYLQCLKWDTQKSEWVWLKELEATRFQHDTCPVRWHVRTELQRDGTVELKLDMRSLVEQPLVLSSVWPTPLLTEHGDPDKGEQIRGGPETRKGWSAHSTEEVSWVSPVYVSTGHCSDHGCQTRPVGTHPVRLTLQPGKTETLTYRMLPCGCRRRRTFVIMLSGWARWSRFDAPYCVTYWPRLDQAVPGEEAGYPSVSTSIISGSATQEQIDDAIMGMGLADMWYSQNFGSAALRRRLIERATSDGKFDILDHCVADDTAWLIVEMLPGRKEKLSPAVLERLLLMAFERLAGSRYGEALKRLGGPRAGFDSALGSVLRQRYSYVDKQALARELVGWPDRELSSLAQAVLRIGNVPE